MIRLESKTVHGQCHMLFQMDCTNTIKANMPIADLIIADPPYFKVVGEKWDYQWRTEEEYLEWSAHWLSSCYHQLRLGGSMYLFGYFRTLGMLLPKLKEIGFTLRQQIVIDKGMKAVAGRATKNYRMFPCTTESVLLLTKDNIQFSRKFLKDRQKKLGLTAKEINEALGVKSNGGGMWSIYTGNNVCEQFPTREIWEKLEKVLDFDIPYESIAQTFNPQMGLTDVWTDIDFYSEKRWHPTQKPLKLIERLISTSSNPLDKVVDPFGGSGSTLIAAEHLGRQAWIIEQDEKYVNAMIDRFTTEVKGCIIEDERKIHYGNKQIL